MQWPPGMRTRPSTVLVNLALGGCAAVLALGGCAAATDGSDPASFDPAGGPAVVFTDPVLAPEGTGLAAHAAERRPPDEEHYHPEPIYSVVMVEDGDVLDVHAGPGTAHEVVHTLAPESTEITGTGREQVLDGQRWIEILPPTTSGTGWVDAFHVTEAVRPARFCEDAGVENLLADLERALLEQDGERLFDVVSPVRGLSVRYLAHGETHRVTDREARELFTDGRLRDWGKQPYTGEQVRGSFADMVAPDLEGVVTHPNTSARCNALELGGAAYDATLPTGMANFNFHALHFAGSEAYGGLDWVTWVVGVDYAEGAPHVVSLHRFAR